MIGKFDSEAVAIRNCYVRGAAAKFEEAVVTRLAATKLSSFVDMAKIVDLVQRSNTNVPELALAGLQLLAASSELKSHSRQLAKESEQMMVEAVVLEAFLSRWP